MSITHHVHTVFANLVHYRLRSVLTLLGIAVGIGAVTAIIAIGEGLHDMVMEEFESVRGGTMVWVSPSRFVDRDGQWTRSRITSISSGRICWKSGEGRTLCAKWSLPRR